MAVDFFAMCKQDDQYLLYRHSTGRYSPTSFNPATNRNFQNGTFWVFRPVYAQRPIIPVRLKHIPDMPITQADTFIETYDGSASVWTIRHALARTTYSPDIGCSKYYDVFTIGDYHYILGDFGIIRKISTTAPYDAFVTNPPSDRYIRIRENYLRFGDIYNSKHTDFTYDPYTIPTDLDYFPIGDSLSYRYVKFLDRNFLYPKNPRSKSKLSRYHYRKFSPYSSTDQQLQLLAVRENMRTIDLVTLTYHDFNDTFIVDTEPTKITTLEHPVILI